MEDDKKTKKQLIEDIKKLRQQSEEELHKVEGEKSAIMDAMSEIVIYLSTDMRIIWSNSAMSRQFNRTSDQVKGRYCYEALHKLSRCCKICPVVKALETGMPQTVEDFPSYGKRWMLRAYPVRNEAGEIIGIVEIVTDNTERKRAEEALRDSEEKYRNIFEYSVEGIFQSTPDGHFRSLNQASAEILGYESPDELIADVKDLAKQHYANPEDRQLFRRKIEEAGEVRNYEIQFLRRDGEKIWISLNARTVRDKDGKVLYYEGTHENITPRKMMEGALIESERRMTDIINFLPDATFVIDLHGKVIFWNRAIEEMTGVKAEDILGKGAYEYAIPFYGVRRPILIDLILKKDKRIESTYDSIIRKKSKNLLISQTWVPQLKGKKVFLWGKASPLYDSKGNLLGAIESIRDITDHKQAQDAIRKREAELELTTHELEDLNTALRVLLKQRENDQRELEDRIISNIKVLVLPQIEKLKEKLDGREVLTHINLLEGNLKEIVSPFAQKLSAKYLHLTNREIQIANLIKEGKATKEITQILDISESSVNFHRYSIRKKLSLTKKHNLHAYLSSLT
ncbi:MAG: hypothetical protein CSYNP_02255 [Syntrophus sp. SKADARSKE-3]|nr:hypothetical protein [Syntrophus sp. SKADARSKE-3]